MHCLGMRSAGQGVSIILLFVAGSVACATLKASEHRSTEPSQPLGRSITTTSQVLADPAPSFVTHAANDVYANRCVIDPIRDVNDLIDDPPYIQAYHSGRSGFSTWAPTTGAGLTHRQGIQRLAHGGKNYFVVSNSVGSGYAPGIELIELGSRWGTLDALGANTTIYSAAPSVDRVASYLQYPYPTYDHAGGLQVNGNYAIVPFEGRSARAGFRIAKLTSPASPLWSTTVLRNRGQLQNAGAAALTKLRDGRFMAFIFGNDADDVEVFLSSGAGMPYFTSGVSWVSRAHATTPSGFKAYQNLQFVTSCSGDLYVLGTHQNGWPSYADWADLWRVSVSPTYVPTFTKVANRNLKCRSANTGNTRYCDFAAGAGAFVSGSGRLLLYAVEHYNDAFPWNGTAVKVREFYP